MEKLQTTKITCSNCGYVWVTASKMYYVVCPRCLKKVKIGERDDDTKVSKN